jgi:hypothetical protein
LCRSHRAAKASHVALLNGRISKSFPAVMDGSVERIADVQRPEWINHQTGNGAQRHCMIES